jgi:pimeloyl-ACP methyl ester carboxylesterase
MIETPAGFVHDRRVVTGARATAESLSTEGVSLHSVIGGTGPALVLLHGWPQTWWAWHRVLPALAEHFTVIAVDLPGLGTRADPRRATTPTRSRGSCTPS